MGCCNCHADPAAELPHNIYAFLTSGLDEYEILLVAGHRKSLQIYIFKTDLLFRVNQKEPICPCSLDMCWDAPLLGPDPGGH